jgi:hypothetical protein
MGHKLQALASWLARVISHRQTWAALKKSAGRERERENWTILWSFCCTAKLMRTHEYHHVLKILFTTSFKKRSAHHA